MKKFLVLLSFIYLLSASVVMAQDSELVLSEIGMFSAGGTITEPVEGEYDPTTNWMDAARPGNTAHVDHANVLFMTPAYDNGNPIVYLHGYGQSRGRLDPDYRACSRGKEKNVRRSAASRKQKF